MAFCETAEELYEILIAGADSHDFANHYRNLETQTKNHLQHMLDLINTGKNYKEHQQHEIDDKIHIIVEESDFVVAEYLGPIKGADKCARLRVTCQRELVPGHSAKKKSNWLWFVRDSLQDNGNASLSLYAGDISPKQVVEAAKRELIRVVMGAQITKGG